MFKFDKRIVFYSLINGVGGSTMSYQLARLLRLPLCQEQKNDLVHFLKSVLNRNRYTLKQIDELDSDDYKEPAVYDLKTPNKKILNLATEIIVLTNNSYLDILKTIATLQQIHSIVKDDQKPIHIIFNRLQNATPAREKKYTKVSKELILSNSFGLNIQFSYIRTSLIYYRGLKDGRFFMDNFFKRDKELLHRYEDVKDLGHTEYLEMFYDNRYEGALYDFSELLHFKDMFDDFKSNAEEYNKSAPSDKRRDTSNKSISNLIVKRNFHLENIRFSQVAIKDMYSLLFKLGDIYNLEMYECLKCKNNSSCWKKFQREDWCKSSKKTGKDLEKCLAKCKCKSKRTNIEKG